MLLIILLFGSGMKSFSQAVVHSTQQVNDSIEELQSTSIQQDFLKPKVNLSVGSSFSTYGSGYNSFGMYVAPEISLPVNKKFSITFGMGYSNITFNTPSEVGTQNSSLSYGDLFVSGTYKVNESLTVRGTAYKTFLMNPYMGNNSVTPQYLDFSKQGIIFDAEYKVSDKFKVGFSIEYSEQNNPYINQFNNSGLSGFGGSSFPSSTFGR